MFNFISDLLSDLNRLRVRQAQIRATIKELSALTDKELSDIGIARGEIYSIAHDIDEAETERKRTSISVNANLKGWA